MSGKGGGRPELPRPPPLPGPSPRPPARRHQGRVIAGSWEGLIDSVKSREMQREGRSSRLLRCLRCCFSGLFVGCGEGFFSIIVGTRLQTSQSQSIVPGKAAFRFSTAGVWPPNDAVGSKAGSKARTKDLGESVSNSVLPMSTVGAFLPVPGQFAVEDREKCSSQLEHSQRRRRLLSADAVGLTVFCFQANLMGVFGPLKPQQDG